MFLAEEKESKEPEFNNEYVWPFTEIMQINSLPPNVVILGPPGSGKSFYINPHLIERKAKKKREKRRGEK